MRPGIKAIGTILGQAVVLAAVGAVLGLGVNAVRPEGLALVAEEPYEIYVPCPMMPAEATPVEPEELADLDLNGLVIVDARPVEAYDHRRIPGSRSLPYHPLKSPPAEVLAEYEALEPNRILVVGDTEIDSGRLLAAELAAAGCLGVRYLEGGLAAWRAAGRPIERPQGAGGAAHPAQPEKAGDGGGP